MLTLTASIVCWNPLLDGPFPHTPAEVPSPRRLRSIRTVFTADERTPLFLQKKIWIGTACARNWELAGSAYSLSGHQTYRQEVEAEVRVVEGRGESISVHSPGLNAQPRLFVAPRRRRNLDEL